ncbi:MAG: hypothetical protein JO328_13960 [Hyphomicrobiales bacterium]|nr:hypothetical protein [Hyphomicrobiales bacterium]MBV8824311.1 hypothetical protein [Hyphomicrobiales bacterium]MBV9427169.1 hypothetical protein [Bradyrhizobiaceae bacterium]
MSLRSLTCLRSVFLAAALALSSSIAQAQPSAATGPATTERSSPVRTGKERLGNKWSDEQGVDNCKVPPEKRGTKARPDTCPPDLTH